MTPSEHFPPASKAWVYAADRRLSPSEQQQILALGEQFTRGWTAHQMQLSASLFILHDLFLVLLLDETVNATSGCGIDKSVAFMKSLEQQFGLRLFNRMQVELLVNGEVLVTDKKGVAELYAAGTINNETPVFNKMITDKQQLDQSFLTPLHQSWCRPTAKSGQLAD